MRQGKRERVKLRDRAMLLAANDFRVKADDGQRIHTSYSGGRGFWPLSRKRGGAIPPSSRKLWSGVKARAITIANKLKD